jgi:predicted aspartyl protease
MFSEVLTRLADCRPHRDCGPGEVLKSIVRCLVLGTLLLGTCHGRPQEVDTPSGSDDGVTFQLSAGYLIVVEGRLGNLSKLRFVLDTGATRSVVDRKVADRLRVPHQKGQREVFSFDKTFKVEQAEFHDVQFGPVRLANLSMLVDDLGRFSEFGSKADVLIGIDLLRMRNFAIDYDSRKVLFSPLDHARSGPFPESDPRFFTVKILIQNRPVNLVVDSGLDGILLYEDRVRESVPKLRIAGRTKPTNFGSRLQAKWATLPNVRIGATDRDTRVLLMNAPPSHILRGVDGYIGTATLGRWIGFNFTNKTLTLRKKS